MFYQVVFVNAPQPQTQPVTVQRVQSFAGHIVFSCFVFWFCNPLFGLIAFILAGALNYTMFPFLNNNNNMCIST